MKISIIAAVAKNGAIGRSGKLLWSLPDDLKNFKKITSGRIVIMGRKTYESIGRPLPNRQNVVVTSQKKYKALGCLVVNSIEDALNYVREVSQEVFVIGGGEIYKQALPYTDKMYLTIVDCKPKADTFFPKFDKSEWIVKKSYRHLPDKNHKYGFTYEEYIRKKTYRKVVDTRYAKSKGYKKILDEIKNEGVCPFCPENFKWHTNPILKEYGGWLITKNFRPYKNSQFHFLIVKKTHKEQLVDLKSGDWKAINNLAVWAIEKYNIKGGALAMRFGNTGYTGATVCHIHAHLIVPKVVKGKTMPVEFPIG